MQLPITIAPYVLLVVSAAALLAAVWFAVRRPTSERPGPALAWQTAQACFAALTATLGAFCVLGALSLLN